MFYSCLLNYGMKSKLYHKNLCNTYKSHPEIFVPQKACEMNEKTLNDIIVNFIHPRYPNTATKKCQKCPLHKNGCEFSLNRS